MTDPQSAVSNTLTSHSVVWYNYRSVDRAYSEYHLKTKYVKTGHFLQHVAYLSGSALCGVAISLSFSCRMTVIFIYFERLNKGRKFR